MNQFKFFKGYLTEEIYWRTAMFEYIALSHMTPEHMFNICVMLTEERSEIPNPYLGKTHQEWKGIFEGELRRRINNTNERV
jgi:hypothetical protein